MRTQEEIAAKIAKHKDEFLGFTTEVLVPYLDYSAAREYLKKGTTPEQWEEARMKDRTDEGVKSALADYMGFAWGKVRDHRGISASRSVDKCSAWAWLLAGDDFVNEIERTGYAQYGAPRLAVICRKFGLPIPDDEPTRRMIRGEPCGEFDGCGCGT